MANPTPIRWDTVKTLKLEYGTDNGKKVIITIQDPKDDLTKADLEDLNEAIIGQDVLGKNSELGADPIIEFVTAYYVIVSKGRFQGGE